MHANIEARKREAMMSAEPFCDPKFTTVCFYLGYQVRARARGRARARARARVRARARLGLGLGVGLGLGFCLGYQARSSMPSTHLA